MTSVGSGTWRVESHGAMLLAAGGTDPGVEREVNEDRFHVDPARGLFVVVDGVGGQAAGGKAADVALSMVRERLERETGAVSDRIREAIAIANNEVYRLASTRAEWAGMACVLTIAVVNNGRASIGHVGDTRLYKIQNGRIEKITRDHSPVGEREDAGELSESQAMRHPRRNEVYRDVGSELHDSGDPDFIDSDEIAFEPDAALLLCTDGLTDLVDSPSIARIVAQRAGDPDAVVTALIDAANAAGGKDNVTVVYLEGERFAARHLSLARTGGPTARVETQRGRSVPTERQPLAEVRPARRSRARRAIALLSIVALAAVLVVLGLSRAGVEIPVRIRVPWLRVPDASVAPLRAPDVQIVQPNGSIAEAIRRAAADSEIVVEPGEYREQLLLKDRIRLVSRVPRGATIRLPATTPDTEAAAAVAATGVSGVELVGFRIVGDSATPLAVGIRVQDSALSIVDVHIAGATIAALEFSGQAAAALLGSEIRDNPGAAIVVHEGAAPRISHNVFARNGRSERAPGTLVVSGTAAPQFTNNVFLGQRPESLGVLQGAIRQAIKNENWFVPVSERRTTRGPASPRTQRSR